MPCGEKTDSIKYLGLMVDQNLKWKLHIEYISGRLSGLLYKFFQLRNILADINLRMVYVALAESIIRYCILIWGGLFQESLGQLNVTQNTLIKILFKKERLYSTKLLYSELGLMNTRQLYTYRCLEWMFNRKHEYSKVILNRNTRYSSHLEVPFFYKTHLQRFAFFHGPKLYNLLPSETKNITSKNKYIIEITNYVLSNYDQINTFFS